MAKIHKPWISWEEFEQIQGGNFTPSPHTHVKADVTDWMHAVSHESGGGDAIDNLTFSNEGLHILDLGGDHDLIIKPGTDLSANRILTITTGDAARTITLSGNPTLADWFDQSVKQAASPTFVTAKLTALTDGYVPYHVSDAVGLANSGIFWDSGNSRVGINLVDPDEDLEVAGNIKATTFLGNLHWDYLTNTPVAYPPEFHFHVGKEIKSLHLVDTTDTREPPGDPLDVLATGAIHGLGTYDWFGTWITAADANCSAEIVVLAGADKILRLTDNNNAGKVGVTLIATSGREMVSGVAEWRMRTSANDKLSYFTFQKGAGLDFGIWFNNDGQIKFQRIGGVAQNLQAYVANTWYRFRVHFDHISRYCVIWIDNDFHSRQALDPGNDGTYAEKLYIYTFDGETGYTMDVDDLKIFNITV